MKYLLVVFGLFASTIALAQGGDQFVVMPSLFYESNDIKRDGDSTEIEQTDLRFAGGYKLGNGFFAGLNYTSNKLEVNDGDSLTYTATGMGVSLGYIAPPVSLVLDYYLDFNFKAEVGSTSVTYFKGTGYALNIGFPFGSGEFRFGPQISYIVMEYDKEKQKSGSTTVETDLDTDYSDKWIKPSFALWWFL